MKSCLNLICLVFVAQSVFAAESEEDDWITMSKKDLCPALHKEAFCTEDSIKFGDIAKEIKKLGDDDSNPISEDQADTGEDASNCGDPVKKAFCSSEASPLCLQDRPSGDDSAERKVCDDLYKDCPLLADQDSLNYTKQCVDYLKRQYSDLTCESVGVDFDDDGGCPRPVRKMPEFYIQIYETKSKVVQPLTDILDAVNDVLDKVWDAECLKTVKELPCMPIYCSEDDQDKVQIKNKRKDCTRAMECVSKASEKLESLTGGVATNLVDQLRDGVKDSCDTIIEGFEDLVDPAPSATGGVSPTEFSIHLTLMAAFLSLKFFW